MAGFDNEVMFALGERLQASTAQAIQLMQQTATDVSNVNFTGNPNGSVAANPSSLCHDPVAGDVWIKATGTGNTGWVKILEAGEVVLTADDGNTLTTSPYHLFGQQAGTVPVNDTAVSGGNMYFANNTWETQYVVDPSTTAGLKGTFTTIQAAINQAVADGASLTVEKKIFIRYGSYTENLNIPPGIFLIGDSLFATPNAIPLFTTITGNHNTNTANIFRAQNLYFVNTDPTADTFTGSGTNLYFFYRCEFQNTGTGLFFTLNFNSSYIFGCFFLGTAFAQQIAITGGAGGIIFENTLFSSCGFANAGNVRFFNCQGIGPIACSNGNVIAYNSQFNGDTFCINGTGSGNTLTNCSFSLNSANGALQYTGSVSYLANCNIVGGTSTLALYDGSTVIGAITSQAGNVYHRTTTATNASADGTMFVISVTDTTAPRTITLPNDGGLDRTWFVLDESLGAATNNITVQVQGGGTINGVSTYVINTNGGSAQFINTGTGTYAVLDQTKLNIGDTVVSTVASGSAVTLTTATPANVTSISVPPGKYAISGVINYNGAITVSGPQLASVNTTSATIGNQGDNAVSAVWLATQVAAGDVTLSVPSWILTVTTTTTVYLVAQTTFSGGTSKAYGRISAVRIQ